MGLSKHPKKFAQDIAEGFISLTQPVLKRYSPGDRRVIKEYLDLVAREIRAERIDRDDSQAIRLKNLLLSRVNRTLMLLDGFERQQRNRFQPSPSRP